eukprot:COSAG06_NODE_36612_length_445_cov_0.505780_1_plen_65_part_00
MIMVRMVRMVVIMRRMIIVDGSGLMIAQVGNWAALASRTAVQLPLLTTDQEGEAEEEEEEEVWS